MGGGTLKLNVGTAAPVRLANRRKHITEADVATHTALKLVRRKLI
jgi:hypothetical protein